MLEQSVRVSAAEIQHFENLSGHYVKLLELLYNPVLLQSKRSSKVQAAGPEPEIIDNCVETVYEWQDFIMLRNGIHRSSLHAR